MAENKPIPGLFVPPGLAPKTTPIQPATAAPAAAPILGGAPAAGSSQPIVPASAAAPRVGGRVIVFSGPKEGVGKTTTALNLALAWAGTQSRNVILIHLDPLCRNELSFLLGLQPPTLASLTQLVGKDVAVLGKLLKGRIPVSQWGVGVLPLANRRSEVLDITPASISPILESLSQSYDLFLDVDPYFPMQIFAFDPADIVFWNCLPQRAHFEATYNMFQELKALHFPLERFEVVINQGNLPGALAPKEVERFFAAMNKRVLSYMPWEDLLPEFANTARILVVEQPHSEWVKSLKPLLARIMEVKPGPKQWPTSLEAEGFSSNGGGGGYVPASSGGGELKPSGGAQIRTVGRAGELPPFWDELKGKMHKSVVAAMETERVRISDSAEKNEEVRKKV
ncbi:MAG TPA: hypothetical protein VNI01_08045, partial [Elusimicrobiota bacterium]|nr:hypothetical protein [Elusimicrobiota bacterium]